MKTDKGILNNRCVILLIFALIFLSLALRWPTTPHEIGQDGFMNNSLAKSITEFGYAKWHVSPYSVFGMGPFSYPAAIHFLISGTSQLTGLSLEISVLAISMTIGVLGMLLTFILTKEITDNNEVSLLSAFLFSTSPVFLRLTTWNGSSRQLAMVFIILLIFLLLRMVYAKRTYKYSHYDEGKYTALALFILVCLASMHRLAILGIFILMGYLIARPAYKFVNAFTLKNIGEIEKKRKVGLALMYFLWIAAIATVIYMQLVNFGPYEGMDLWSKYQSGLFFRGSDIGILLTNMIIDYWSGWGVLSVFLLIGAYYLFKQRNKDFKLFFLLLSILLMAPISTLGLYAQLFLICLITPVAAIGIIRFLRSKHFKKIALPITISLIIISLGFSMFMTDHWIGQSGEGYMNERQYDTGMYTDHYLKSNETYISNNQVFANRVLSVSDAQYLTEGFAYPMIYGWVDEDNLEKIIDWDSMIENQSVEISYPEEYALLLDHRYIKHNDVDDPISEYLRSYYDVRYSVDNRISTTNYYIESSLEAKRYKIFDNGEGRIWYLGQ